MVNSPKSYFTNRNIKDWNSVTANITTYWAPMNDPETGALFGAIGLQSDLSRTFNCMPDFLTEEYAAPSYMIVMDSNLTVYQHWSNKREVPPNGYGSLVKNTGKLLNAALSTSASFPNIGRFYCSKNGHLTVRLTAVKFDAPDGKYTYFIGTGQHESLQGFFTNRF